MTGFVYKWTNLVNGKWYIGSHKGTIDDGYKHSSEVLKAAEAKYGQENFVREILFTGDYDNDEIRLVEGKYLSEAGAATNPESYNRTNMIGTNCYSEETNRKRTESLRNRVYTEDMCRANARVGNTNGAGNKGKTHSEETKEVMSIKKLGNTNARGNKSRPWSAKRRAAYEAKYDVASKRIVQNSLS